MRSFKEGWNSLRFRAISLLDPALVMLHKLDALAAEAARQQKRDEALVAKDEALREIVARCDIRIGPFVREIRDRARAVLPEPTEAE